jgi:lysyl-tRNA synthetase class 2
MILIGGVLGIVILTTIALETTLKVTHHHFMSFTEAAEAVIGRLVGIQTETVPQHINVFLAPTLLALGIGLAAGVALLFTRPVINRTTTDRLKHNSSLLDPLGKKVRELVSHWGNNSLDYFILRNDKQYFFHSDCLISYRVISAICLVSPDPIGPDDMRERTWSLFRQFVDKQGLPVAVMAASEEWLPIYRNSGMHDFYLGDEAIIEVNNFNLEGGKMKGLRQAYNRIANYGYYATFHNPTPANQEIREELKVIMEKGRKGEGERGFSMSLNRLFDTQDPDLLLTVVHNKDGFPVGFCQFVPFMGNKGYSLDLMRRDNGQHPNGLIDFLIISTIKYLANSQVEILSLNFTVMRSLLSGEMGEGLLKKTEQRFYQWLSSSKELQIESLWRFSAKYHPIWKPRYIVIDSPEHLLPITIAIVQAEAIRELPLVGRLVSPVSID